MSDFIHQDDGSYLVTGQAGQDLKDGAAHRKLLEALPDDGWIRLAKRPTRSAREYPIGLSGSHWSGVKYGHTIAEAADKCRAALSEGKA